MRYGQIREYDVANGPGIRTSIFVTGCTRQCLNCFNEEYQDFNFGDLWTKKESDLVLSFLKKDNIKGLTILGGEPFENTKDLINIVQYIASHSNKSIWIYSGWTFEQLIKDPDNVQLLKLCDVLVDGPFVEDLKDLNLKFRGSSNQRIINIKETFKNDDVILHNI